MPTRLVQTPSHASGTAALQISGGAVSQFPVAETLELAILQYGTVERYLDPRNPKDPWTTAVYRFRPLQPRREAGAVWLEIDYGVTYHLRANQPYKLLVRDALTGVEIEERFTGPATMRRPSAPPEGWTPPPDPSGPMTAPPPPPPPPQAPPVAPPVEPVVEAAPPEEPPAEVPVEVETQSETGSGDQKADEKPKGKGMWMALAAVVVALAAGVPWWLLRPPPAGPVVADAKPTSESLESVRKFIAGGPEVAAAKAKADELAKAGQLLDGQFLLYKYAGEKGDAAAAISMGTFYDPDLWSKEKSPLPAANPLEAARWYKQAAEAGNAEAQYRYGMALKKGRTDEPNAEDQAVGWLRKSAEQGNALAKKEIGQ
jgi:hypothetical protein